jgi:16S rRNA U1498 N3-methylase RsmE
MAVAPEIPVERLPAEAWLASPGAEGPGPAGPCTLVVGPEGGLVAAEEAHFARRFPLGRTILRIETAALAAAARVLA